MLPPWLPWKRYGSDLHNGAGCGEFEIYSAWRGLQVVRMGRRILVIDTGTDIVGIYRVVGATYARANYRAYRGYKAMVRAVQRVQSADEVVTYNGNNRDLIDLAALATRAGMSFSLRGKHSDMREVCWPRIWGSSLRNTYARLLGSLHPGFPAPYEGDPYEGDNELDIYETYMLWKAWRAGQLEVG